MRQPAYKQIRFFSSGLPCVHGTTTNRTESTRNDSSRLAASRLVMSGQPSATCRHSPRHLSATYRIPSCPLAPKRRAAPNQSRSFRGDFPLQIQPLRQFPLDRNRATDHNASIRVRATVHNGFAPTAPVRQAILAQFRSRRQSTFLLLRSVLGDGSTPHKPTLGDETGRADTRKPHAKRRTVTSCALLAPRDGPTPHEPTLGDEPSRLTSASVTATVRTGPPRVSSRRRAVPRQPRSQRLANPASTYTGRYWATGQGEINA